MREVEQEYDVRERLEWFLHNLELQLDDEEMSGKGVRIDEYWDTADVRRAILGLEEFFDGESVNVERFKERKTLVTCLAAEGSLGSIRLLEPHQAEFAKSLRSCFGLNGQTVSESRRDQFFQAIGLPDGHELKLDGFAQKSSAEKSKILGKFAGQAETLFKAVQCVHGNWRWRLGTMYKNKLLDFSPSAHLDYSEIFADPLFQKLRQRLGERRPDRSKNNIADAACICLLQKHVTEFNSDKSKQLPHFFESRRTFRESLDDIPEAPSLTYKGYAGKEYSIFRDFDYYVFKATFRAGALGPLSEKTTGSVETLTAVRATVVELLQAAGPLNLAVANRISVNGRPLGDLISELRRYWFLERIWLPYAASKAITAAAYALEYSQSDAEEHAAFQKTIDEAIERVTGALDRNVSEYRWFSDLWIGLEQQAKHFRTRFKNRSPEHEQIYRLWGLGRFGIPEEFREDVESSIAGLVLGDEETLRRELAHISQICIDVKERKRNGRKTILLSVLWTLEMDSAIRDLRIDFATEDTWLVAIAAASATRVGEGAVGRRALKEIESRYSRSSEGEPKARLAISIAYIYFHLWRQGGGNAVWRNTGRSRGRASKADLQALIDQAINFAEVAYKIPAEDPSVRVYALNILLYYITEGASDEKFGSAQELSQELREQRQDLGVWQYRFDDTLARYFHRRSTRESSPENKQRLLELARRYIDYAVRDSFGDPEVEDYEALLVDIACSSR